MSDCFDDVFGLETFEAPPPPAPEPGQMTFADALKMLTSNEKHRVVRKDWARGFFIGVYHPSASMTQPYLFIQEPTQGDAPGARYPWVPDQDDLFASDWMTFEEHNKKGLEEQKENLLQELNEKLLAGLGGGLGEAEEEEPTPLPKKKKTLKQLAKAKLSPWNLPEWK